METTKGYSPAPAWVPPVSRPVPVLGAPVGALKQMTTIQLPIHETAVIRKTIINGLRLFWLPETEATRTAKARTYSMVCALTGVDCDQLLELGLIAPHFIL
jgi:hypothetical protein